MRYHFHLTPPRLITAPFQLINSTNAVIDSLDRLYADFWRPESFSTENFGDEKWRRDRHEDFDLRDRTNKEIPRLGSPHTIAPNQCTGQGLHGLATDYVCLKDTLWEHELKQGLAKECRV
ncbi:uncharacterized protein YALI1_D08693g [Yarrowia lipolytica]|uniref:Uncharacterized protein n=1 Tax=Yarrowia lipolytica TaxID=4952 RepID=A0A1D8NDI0_YARLL|nr:hypothetical protein YALI1_D08693g [Yarrowia lipolytica]